MAVAGPIVRMSNATGSEARFRVPVFAKQTTSVLAHSVLHDKQRIFPQ